MHERPPFSWTLRDARRSLAAPAAIVLFAAAFFAPELFFGRVAATANMARWRPWRAEATAAQIAAPSHNPDCNLSYYPRRDVLHEAWRTRTIPFWNPCSFAGAPFLADVQAGVFYPPNWVLLPFDPKWQLGAFLFLHAAWGGLGLFVLSRRLGVAAPLAALAGCAFALNGYFVKHFGQPPFLAAASWAPWLLAAALAVRERPNARRAALFGAAGALTFLAGQPQTASHAALAVGLVLVVREASASAAARAGRRRALAAFAAGTLLAGLLTAIQLLPTADLARRSARLELPYETVLSGAFHPVDVVRFAVEEFFGSPLTEDEWSGSFPRGDGVYIRHQLNSIFAGTPVFLLALWGAFSRGTRRAALPWTLLLLLAALVAFGSPLARIAYEFLPGFRFSRIDRLGYFVVLAQAVLAALAAQDLAGRAASAARGRRAFGFGIAALAAAGALAAGAAAPERARVVERTRIASIFAGAAGLALAAPSPLLAATAPHALAALQLAGFGAPYRGDRRPQEVFAPHESIAALRALLEEGEGGGRMMRFGRGADARATPVSSALPPSTNVPYGVRDLQGYNALADSALGRTLEVALGEPLFSTGIWAGRRIVEPTQERALEHPLLDALAVRAAVSEAPVNAPGWSAVETRGFFLSRNDEALGRVRLVPQARGVSADSMQAILRAGSFDPAREAYWIGEGEVAPPQTPERAAAEAPPGETPSSGAPAQSDAPPPSGGPASSDPTTPAAVVPLAEPETPEVELLVDDSSEIVVRANAPFPALLVVADSWSPGWRARVDGNGVPIERVWGIVRGIRLGPGSHLVEMRYVPPGYRTGSILSFLGLLLLGSMIAWTRAPKAR